MTKQPTEVAKTDRRTLLTGGAASLAVATLALRDGAAAAQTSTPAPAMSGVGQEAPDAPRSGEASVAQHRVEVPAPHGVVAAGHPLASMAGTMMLMRGGTAADAVVAAMATLNVVEPWSNSAAGVGLATCLDRKSGKISCLAFTGAAPRKLDDRTSVEELTSGPKAVVTPAAFGGWIELTRRFGRMSLSELLAPAIGYARDGHPLDPSISQLITRMASRLARYPTTAAIFLPDGAPPPPRSLFRNIPLARTFQALADAETAALKGGASRDQALQAAYDYFFTGPIAQEMARFSQSAGGWLSTDDMRAYKPRWADPCATTYRGHEIYCAPLTSRSGLEICEQLNLIEGFDIGSMPPGSPQALHLIAEAIKVAKADVYRYAADLASSPTPVATLISKDFAAQRRKLINPTRAIPFPTGANLGGAWQPPPSLNQTASVPGDTTHLSAMDSEGNAIGVTTTIGGGFGTQVVMGNTGLLCNNGLRTGSTAPYRTHPNFVAPGRIPLLGNCPVIVRDHGQFRMIFGTPGGETIGQTQFQHLIHVLDYGMPVQAAIEAPRFALHAEPGFYTPGAAITLQAESRYSENAIAGLKAMGHRVELVGPYAIGSIQAILESPYATRSAGSDPRRMGYAIGY